MTDIESPAPRRRLPVFTGIAVLAALAILISLGTWQVERLHWKEGLLADIAARRAAAPVPLADIEALAAKGGEIIDQIPVDPGMTRDGEYRLGPEFSRLSRRASNALRRAMGEDEP